MEHNIEDCIEHVLMEDIEIYIIGYLNRDLLNNQNLATTCDFQQCGILTSVDSDKPVQPAFKLRNSK